MIVTREEKLLLLDLSVPGNGFVMKKMQIPAVRAHFVMPAGKKRSGMAVGIDLYGLGKLFQDVYKRQAWCVPDLQRAPGFQTISQISAF